MIKAAIRLKASPNKAAVTETILQEMVERTIFGSS